MMIKQSCDLSNPSHIVPANHVSGSMHVHSNSVDQGF